MNNPGNYRENLEVGMTVEVNLQRDRSRKMRAEGKITKILTHSPQHTHGILVELDNGEIGRVKNIISNSKISVKPTTVNSNTPLVTDHRVDLISLIERGESHLIEYKSSALWSLRLSADQIKESSSFELSKYGQHASKFIIAKSIAGFLNADGGHLLIGIKENKSENIDDIIGIDSELYKLEDKCVDGYRRMIVEKIIKVFLPSFILHHINQYIQLFFEKFDNKTVSVIKINKSDEKVFLIFKNQEHFYVRVDSTTRELQGEEMVSYCLKRFA